MSSALATRRGTSNSNVRGSSEDRRRRREWLVKTYRANESVIQVWDPASGGTAGGKPVGAPTWTTRSFGDGSSLVRLQEQWGRIAKALPACRCYRCGRLLTVDTVTVDRIIPGCKGGTYRRNNIRPACGPCNSETGGGMRR